MRLDDFTDETCAWCGKPFETTRTDQKYCSYRCRRQSRSKFITAVVSEERRLARAGRTCPQCGKEFDANKGDRLYCTPACTRKALYDHERARQGLPPLAEALAALRCQRCGIPLTGATRTDTKHCRPCKRVIGGMPRAERRRQARAGKRCAVCGEPFEAVKVSQIYCSSACSNRAYRKRLNGDTVVTPETGGDAPTELSD